MKIKMNKTCKGSPDGVNVNVYESGKEYDLSGSLVEAFLSDGRASKADEKKADKQKLKAKAKARPKNKARKKPDNK